MTSLFGPTANAAVPIAAMFFYYVFISGIQPDFNIGAGTASAADSSLTITITAVGDLMCHSDQFLYAQVSPDSFNFLPDYRYVDSLLAASDITVGNLETVLAGKSEKYSGYPFFNAPDEFAAALKTVGFDLVNHANNHCLDRGEKGIRRTLQTLDALPLKSTGTFRSEADRDSLRIINVKNTRVGFLAYTYGTNGNPVPRGKNYLVNLIDTVKIKADLDSARKKCELLVVLLHFGLEYERYPNDEQRRTTAFLAQNGVDLILASHPHVLQPVSFFKCSGASLDSGLCAYSLGNFFSNQRWRYSDAGAILTISIEKKIGGFKIASTEAVPTWVYKGRENGRKVFYIIPSTIDINGPQFDFISPSEKQKFTQAMEDSRDILKAYSKKIVLR